MQEYALSYDAILEYFGEETISDRYKYIYDKMQEYINARNLHDALTINETILHQVIMDYFSDIYRLKDFHSIDKVNMMKIVSYEVFWILRRKPIQVVDVLDDSKFAFVNEGFATTFIAHECLIPKEMEPLNENKTEEFLKFLRHVNYHLKYRPIDKQNLEIMLYAFEIGKYITKDNE